MHRFEFPADITPDEKTVAATSFAKLHDLGMGGGCSDQICVIKLLESIIDATIDTTRQMLLGVSGGTEEEEWLADAAEDSRQVLPYGAGIACSKKLSCVKFRPSRLGVGEAFPYEAESFPITVRNAQRLFNDAGVVDLSGGLEGVCIKYSTDECEMIQPYDRANIEKFVSTWYASIARAAADPATATAAAAEAAAAAAAASAVELYHHGAGGRHHAGKNHASDESCGSATTFHVLNLSWRSNLVPLDMQCMSVFSAILLDALLTHPRFYRPLLQRQAPREAALDLFFMDFETALETNWPVYGQGDGNWVRGNHSACFEKKPDIFRQLSWILNLLKMPPHARLVLFYFGGEESAPISRYGDQVVGVSISHEESRFRRGIDVSWLSRALHEYVDRPAPCSELRYVATFRGVETHPIRSILAEGHDPDNGFVVQVFCRTGELVSNCSTKSEETDSLGYDDLLTHTLFALIPRGHSAFSYRLAEALSAGAIPVILADGLVLPFDELIAWEGISIRIPEARAHDFKGILQAIPREEACAMRERTHTIYKRHLSTTSKQLDSLVEVLEARQKKRMDSTSKGV